MQNNLQENREKIAARLKEARVASGLSQDEAAKQLGLKRPAVSEIESGRRKVTAEEIIHFAEMYRVNKSWLLLEEEEEDSRELKIAARELSKLSIEDRKKLLSILKLLPK
jgi:transcriptional regulator with XRE-family HTH domain